MRIFRWRKASRVSWGSTWAKRGKLWISPRFKCRHPFIFDLLLFLLWWKPRCHNISISKIGVRYTWGGIFPFRWDLCSNGVVAGDCDILWRMIDWFQLVVVVFFRRRYSHWRRILYLSFSFLIRWHFAWWFIFSRRTLFLQKCLVLRIWPGKRLPLLYWSDYTVQLWGEITSGCISTANFLPFWLLLLYIVKWLIG